MILLVCVDDTDDVSKSTSTGKIADMIAKNIEELGGVLERGITRHQLLIHDDIPYTSHNSAMCMSFNIDKIDLSEIKSAAEEVLLFHKADSSDPGLCFCDLSLLGSPEKLIAFGKRAQNELLTKEDAYRLASEFDGLILEEYGGTGLGVIGALAGIGLRLSGYDGTFRGGKENEQTKEPKSATEWKIITGAEQIVNLNGEIVDDSTMIHVGKKIKYALFNGMRTLVVKNDGDRIIACKKSDLYDGDTSILAANSSCEDFEHDNDMDECYEDFDISCYNCLYRRWTTTGFGCMKKETAIG